MLGVVKDTQVRRLMKLEETLAAAHKSKRELSKKHMFYSTLKLPTRSQ